MEEVLQSYSKINEASLLRLKIVIYQTEGRKKKKAIFFFFLFKKNHCVYSTAFMECVWYVTISMFTNKSTLPSNRLFCRITFLLNEA